jgi:D-beta-D-heptose 7-phosphate kinase / D-beta-D-heptose 1-phosphate adenosyltransferase
MDLPRLLDAVAGTRLLVVGDSLLDTYRDGRAHRLSRESPVPVVQLDADCTLPGGAANAAVNASALGGRVRLATVVGDDPGGAELCAALDGAEVDTRAVLTSDERATARITRIRASGQLVVRLDEGDTGPVRGSAENRLVQACREALRHVDGVLVSDYGKGVVGARLRAAICREAARRRLPVVVDAKVLGPYREFGVTAVKPNWSEVQALLGTARCPDAVNGHRVSALSRLGDLLHELTGAKVVAVTLDRDGSLVFEHGRPVHRTTARARPDTAAIGAGDTYVAALTLGLAAGATGAEAAELASMAADVVLERPDTAVCTALDLRRRHSRRSKVATDPADLAARVAADRSTSARVVFVNGCFDLLHRGHLQLLERAAGLGDVLVVAVNSDDSVARLKGPGRPVLPLEERLAVLAALDVVSHLAVFDTDRPVELLEAVHPDLYVKGSGYRRENLPEADLLAHLGIPVRFLPGEPDDRTARLLRRAEPGSAAG